MKQTVQNPLLGDSVGRLAKPAPNSGAMPAGAQSIWPGITAGLVFLLAALVVASIDGGWNAVGGTLIAAGVLVVVVAMVGRE